MSSQDVNENIQEDPEDLQTSVPEAEAEAEAETEAEAEAEAETEAEAEAEAETEAETEEAEEPEAESADPQEAISEDPNDPCTSAREEIAVVQRELDVSSQEMGHTQLQARKLKRRLHRIQLELSEKEKDLQEIRNAQLSLEEWIKARDGGFAWQLADSLDAEKNKAQRSRESASSWLRSGREKTIQLLLPLDSKSRLWPQVGAQIFILTALVILFQYLRNSGLYVWTEYIPTPWPMIGFASLILLGLALNSWLKYERAFASSVLVARWKDREERGVQGLDTGQHALALIDFARRILVPIPLLIAAGFGIMFVRDVVPTVVAAYFPQAWIIWLIMLVLYLGVIFRAWFAYYRFVSQLRYQIVSVLYEAKRQSNAYIHALNEEARLEAMHSLVPDYLEMLGKPIHNPWAVDLSDVRDSEMRPDGALLPASVGLAEATGGDTQQWNVMENRSRSLLYRPGWITQSFRELLDRISAFEGLNPRTLTLDSLAADPGDSRRGQRRLVSEMSTNPEILSSAGKARLRSLSESIQRGVIREVKPLVEPLRMNELGDLDISTSRFRSDNRGQVPWNDFLFEALSDAAPFSMLTFSESGVASRSYYIHESHALVPNDLGITGVSRSIQIIDDAEASHSSPLDLVVRIDHSDWLEPDKLTLFGDIALPTPDLIDTEDGFNHGSTGDFSEIVRHPDE